MRSMALKMNVSPKDQDTLNDILQGAGYERQLRKFHCTVGFIEKMIPEEEAIAFGQKITALLHDYMAPLSLTYEVQTAAHLFGHVIAFLPTNHSLESLKKVNAWLGNAIAQVSEGRWFLNEETTGSGYTPHMTLWRSRHVDARFKKLEKVALSHPLFQLREAAYVILN